MQQFIYLDLLMLVQLLFVLKLKTTKCLNCFVSDLWIVICKIRKYRFTHELQNIKTWLYLIKTKMF